MKRILIAVGLLLTINGQAAVKLPKVFGDNMVLQRGRALPVWGWADKGEKVTVTFAGQNITAVAKDGRWRVDLEPLEASAESRSFTVNNLVLKNVLVGDVWVCSGQSNMEWPTSRALHFKEESAAANWPLIRQIKIPKVPSMQPLEDVNASWQVCTPNTVGNFTGVGYFFAKKLHQEIKVPIGLVNSSWGGTRIEPWTPLVGFRKIADTDFAPAIIQELEANDPSTEAGRKKLDALIADVKNWVAQAEARAAAGHYPPKLPQMNSGRVNHQAPAMLYRGMIHPLIPFGIKGAIWYQGESNGGEGLTYYHKMHALIKGWRDVWGQGDFPFYHVQLANFTADKKDPAGGDGYAKIRDFQRKSLDVPKSGMAVIIDIGETRDIHPKNKQDVGRRLAQWALAKEYGKAVVPSGPLYKSHEIQETGIRIHFTHVGKGLVPGMKTGVKPVLEMADANLERFAIAGEDKKWVWAKARIDGETVVVSSPDVPKPVAVRYAYSANPLGANLYNKDGFPASPFRTDNW